MDKLVVLALEANARPEWHEFALYCELRGRGIRSGAFDSLGRFIEQAVTWTFDARLQFARWALEYSNLFYDRGVLLPTPVRTSLLMPTLMEWSANSPREAQAHLWLGLLGCDDPRHHLTCALEFDPTCEAARQTLANWILGDIEYNQHHLPDFYILDPRGDLSTLIQVERLIEDSSSESWAETTRKEVLRLRMNVDSWLAAHP